MRIFLDDLREAPEGWTLARTFAEFQQLVLSGEPIEALSFDHDLGESEPTGYEAVKWLSEHRPELLLGESEISIHSANPVGRDNIEAFIDSCRRHGELLLEAKRENPSSRSR